MNIPYLVSEKDPRNVGLRAAVVLLHTHSLHPSHTSAISHITKHPPKQGGTKWKMHHSKRFLLYRAAREMLLLRCGRRQRIATKVLNLFKVLVVVTTKAKKQQSEVSYVEFSTGTCCLNSVWIGTRTDRSAAAAGAGRTADKVRAYAHQYCCTCWFSNTHGKFAAVCGLPLLLYTAVWSLVSDCRRAALSRRK